MGQLPGHSGRRTHRKEGKVLMVFDSSLLANA